MSLREESKEERRRAILSAAEKLLREGDGADFSMRALAREAGVSFATPFNLFDNKAGILVSLMTQQVAQHRHSLERVSKQSDPIEKLFRLIDVSVEGYTADPQLIRPLFLAIESITGPERRHVRDQGALVWKPALEAARTEKAIDPKRDLNVLARSLNFMFRESLSAWASGEMEVDEFKLQAQYSLSVWMLSAATPAHHPALEKKRNALERKLSKIRNS